MAGHYDVIIIGTGVGAGPTGAELAGQIREVATKTLRSEYREINPEDARELTFTRGDLQVAAGPYGGRQPGAGQRRP